MDTGGGILNVRIDVPRIQLNIQCLEGARLPERVIRAWLLNIGLTPQPDGSWTGAPDALCQLDATEFVEVATSGAVSEIRPS